MKAHGPPQAGQDQAGARLRVGLLLDDRQVCAWEFRMLRGLLEVPGVELALCVVNAGRRHGSGVGGRFSGNWRNWAWWMTERMDRFLFKPAPDAMERVDVEPLVKGVKWLEVAPRQTADADFFPPHAMEEIRSAGIDLLVRLGFRNLRGEVLTAPSHGVWSHRWGDGQESWACPPAYWEVALSRPVTSCTLLRMTEETGAGETISRVDGATYPFSITRNRNRVCWESASQLPRAVGRLIGDSGIISPRDSDPERAQPRPHGASLCRPPGNAEALVHAVRLAGRVVRRFGERLLTREQWFLLSHRGGLPEEGTLQGYRPIIPPRDRFWADPFIVRHEENDYVFFEEMIYERGKAHISVLRLDADGTPEPSRPVLIEPWHLSYPFLFEIDRTLYMIPESMERRSIEVYRCTSFPDNWEHEATLMDGVEAVDTTLVFHGDRWWMFTVLREHPGASDSCSLHLFYSSDPLSGHWVAHPLNPVLTDCRQSRPAGKVFQQGGKLYRPSQDCSLRYGYATNINEVMELSPTAYRERCVSRILPDWGRDILGTHHLAVGQGLTVIDAVRRIRRW